MPGQVTGTIGDQDVRLENAATESTLALLVAAMDKLAAKSGKGGKEGKLQELYNKRLEETNKLKEEEAERLHDVNEQLVKSKQKWQQFGQDMSAIIGSVFTNTTVGLNSLANVFDNMGPLGQIAGALTRVVSQNVEVFRQLSGVGIDFGDSIFDAQTAAARAGLPLDIFAKTITNNAGSLALFGGSATEGARRFTEVSNAMRKNGFAQSMAKLGYSMEDVAEHTAGYMEQLTMLGKSQKMSDAELAEGTQTYLLELDKLARMTGMSRKEAEASMKQQVNDKRLRALMATMGEKERLALQGVTAALTKASPELAEGISELVATNGVPISDFGKSLARNNPALVENAKALREGRISQEQFAQSVRDSAENNSALSEEEEKLHAYLVARGKSSPFADRVAMQSMKNFGKDLQNLSAQQKAAMESEGKAVAGFDEAMTQIVTAIKVLLLPIVKVVSFALGGLSTIITNVMGFLDRMGTQLEEVLGKDVWASMKTGFTYLVSGLAAVVTALYAYKLAMATKEVAGGAGGLLGKATGGGGVGKGAASAGEGIGKGVGGALSGLAEGLGKLGSPKVLLGVVALVGIGAAMFVAAKALQSFASVAWEDMAKGFVALAGLGALGLILSLAAVPIAIGAGVIALLGASLLPLAAAIAIAAPGLGELSEKITGLADVDAGNLAAVGASLGILGAGLGALGAGSVMEAIGSFFGGDLTEKLNKFGAAAPGIQNLATSLKDLDFDRLSTDNVNTDSLEIGAKRAERLANQLASVKAQMDKISAPSLTETLTGAFDNLSTKITAAFSTDDKSKGTAPKKSQESLLTDVVTRLDQLNTQMADLLEAQTQGATAMKKTAKNTKWL